jgi:hypothetical protein
MYSYFFPVFLFPRCIPYVFGYFWLLHVFRLLSGIPAISRYSYFFQIFLFPTCITISSR